MLPRLSSEPALSSRRAWAVTFVATATMAISYLDRQVLAVLAPTVQAELDLTDSEYGWGHSAFSLAYLVAAPFAGRLLERMGIRNGMLVAVLCWSAIAAAHAGLTGFGPLLLLRALLGVGESPSFPGSAAAITRAQPPHARPRAIGVLYTGSSFGAMVAPPLATALAATFFGWRGAFVGVAIAGLVWVPLWLWVTGAPEVRAALAARLPASQPAPSLFSVGTHPAVLRASILVASCSPLFAFVLLWGSKVLVEVHGIAQDDVGRYLPWPPVLFDLGAVLFGHLASVHARRHGAFSPPRALAVCAGLAALTIAALPFATGPWSFVAIAGIAMAGGAGLFAMLTADMVSRVGPGLAASAGGFTASVQSVLYVIANPLFGYGREHLGGYTEILLTIGIAILPGLAVWLLWVPRAPDEPGRLGPGV